MAKLEFYRQQVVPRIATPSGRGLAAVGTQAAETAEAISRLATLGAKIQDNARAAKLVDLNARATADLNDFVLSLERDSDFDTQEERYRARVKEIESRVQKEVGDDNRLLDMWRREFSVPVNARAFDVKKNALRGTIQTNRAKLDDSLYTLSQLTGSGNPALDEHIAAQGTVAIDNMLASGDITPEEAVNKRQEFIRLASNNSAEKALISNPEKFEIDLIEGKFANLTTADRLAFQSKAANAIQEKTRLRLAQEDRERRQIADEAQKDLDIEKTAGTLSRSKVLARRDDLSPDDFRYFLTETTGGATKSNPNIYASLLVRASSGQDVTKEARNSFSRGNLSKEDFDRLVSISSGSGWYKRGAQLISGALRVSELNPDPAAAQRLTSAINAWNEYAQGLDAKQIQNMTSDQALAEANRLIKEFAIIDTQNFALTLRLPRYIVGSRERPDLDATEDKTLEEFESGRISQQEFNAQSALIKQWRQAITSMQSMQPPSESGASRR
jgi:hypothetical protein